MRERGMTQERLAADLGTQHSTVSAWLKVKDASVPGGINLRAIAEGVPADGKPVVGRRAVTTDWLLCIDGAPKFPEERLIADDFRRYLTEEVIRLGREEWNGRSQAGKLPAWISEALPELITPAAVMAELRSVALQTVVRARQLYDEQLSFAKIEARLRGDGERRSRTEKSRNERSAREFSAHAYMRYVEISGDVSHELLGDEGRAFRAGLLAYERRHRRAALAAQGALARTARTGKPRRPK